MSGVNIACNIGNQMGHGAGEMKFDVTSKDPVNLASCIAAEVVNDILENALDIATMGDTIAFSVEDAVCSFPTQLVSKSQEIEVEDQCQTQIKDIIDGLSTIHVPNQSIEESTRLDIEMKKLLNEMMSPPYEIVNYEAIPRKDGVGDQPIEDIKEDEDYSRSEDCLVDVDKVKVVEKKTRVTDLVMNSKQVLTELLMSEETRNKQAEWEENNETVLQVIELDCVKPEETEAFKLKHLKEKSDLIFAPVAQEECLVNIDLNKKDEVKEEMAVKNEDQPEDDKSLAGSSFSRTSEEINKEKFRNKFENLRKKWNINFKLFTFGKRKQKAKEENANL